MTTKTLLLIFSQFIAFLPFIFSLSDNLILIMQKDSYLSWFQFRSVKEAVSSLPETPVSTHYDFASLFLSLSVTLNCLLLRNTVILNFRSWVLGHCWEIWREGVRKCGISLGGLSWNDCFVRQIIFPFFSFSILRIILSGISLWCFISNYCHDWYIILFTFICSFLLFWSFSFVLLSYLGRSGDGLFLLMFSLLLLKLWRVS